MTTTIASLKEQLEPAVASGKLLAVSADNILQLLERGQSPLYLEAIAELVASEQWAELNDRFFRTLAFGTGGLRGRTIGKVLTRVEMGTPTELDRPEFPCVGTNAMNYYNISRATQGLVAYLKEWFVREKMEGKPSICIAHDTRHFSRDFAELTAKIAAENGCDAYLFSAPRSTPELSFAVRYTRSHAGIVITASHNPPHDNGYKVYFADGAQVVEPHASGIIEKVNAASGEVYTPLPIARQGTVKALGAEVDAAYMDRLQTMVLEPDLVAKQNDLKIVYTPLHGTGGAIIKPMLDRLGFQYLTVEAQETPDGRFPTVKSPNPENAEALKMAIELANDRGADVVMATDPDCDRMGVAVATRSGEMKLLSGNQIGSLIAYHRISTLFRQGVLTPENASRAVLIKTFVTSDLQNAIAAHYGLRCVETLTGFKYNGAKLKKYEDALPEEYRRSYVERSEKETRDLRLKYSSYYVCGGEESYGYSAHDFVRDKDGNAAVVMFAEIATCAKSRGLTVDELMDEVFSIFGFYLEKNNSIMMEGAEGAAKIQQLLASYAASPPTEMDGVAVTEVRDFARQTVHDVEGDRIPAEKMLILLLEDGRKIAVRGSGTEPKIKYYMFGHRKPPVGGRIEAAELARIKDQVGKSLNQLWNAVQRDAEERIQG